MSKETNKPSKTDVSQGSQKPDQSDTLQGWPGYRTRQNRSGYDPIDTDTESGHMLGIFLRRLFTGQLRTRNPFYLACLAVLGLLGISPLLLAFSGILQGNPMPGEAWVYITLAGILGIALLVNLIKNLIRYRK